jgi:His-Xaa-Ser system radical SAM maturase HxsB
MTHILPLRFDEITPGTFLLADDGGAGFVADERFVERYATDQLNASDLRFLRNAGYEIDPERRDLNFVAALKRYGARFANPAALNYIILVPTLRCDLKCSYCQVSRVDEFKAGFDWTDDQIKDVIAFLDGLSTSEVQIEFQGGEPLLRIDILETIAAFCRERFETCRFIVCTNLNRLDEDVGRFIAAPDVFISTSLDGSAQVHQHNRTKTAAKTEQFYKNLRAVLDKFGKAKVSALPTIDYASPPEPDDILDAFDAFGLWSIYLRPVNYQGFARKAHSSLRDDASSWIAYYERFIARLLKRNAQSDAFFEEFTLTLALKRCLQTGHDSHVDFRNPSYFAKDYVVVDYDGRLYPTDEARMLTRTGIVDLAIGDVREGITAHDKLASLHSVAVNNLDPDCQHCVYQPACGADPIDDISRYGRIDIPRHQTFFCQRQTALFRLAWRLIVSQDADVRRSVCAWLGLSFSLAPLVPVHD